MSQQEQPQVGPAMWGGLTLPDAGRRRPKAAPEPAPARRVEWQDVAALAALVLAVLLLPAGAYVSWGLGAGLLAGGAVAGAVAVLLGLGER